MNMEKGKNYGMSWLGIALVLFGALLILDEWYYYFNFWDLWPAIFVLIGLKKITSKPRELTAGIIFSFIGAFFLMKNFHFLPYEIRDNFLPILLIVIGLLFILQRKEQKENHDERDLDAERDYIKANAVFGGSEIVVQSKNFKGGDLFAAFGSVEVDLRHANLANGHQYLYANAIFGGIELRVPEEWHVKFESSAIFGGNDDTRSYKSEMIHDLERVLIIKGLVLFGGIEVKS
jgi:predicted membrane protein